MTDIYLFCSNSETSFKFFLTHSSLMKEIASAISHFLLYDVGVFLGREIIIHSGINDKQHETMLTTEHINATATFSVVYHLLPSNLTRRK